MCSQAYLKKGVKSNESNYDYFIIAFYILPVERLEEEKVKALRVCGNTGS
jgi:hypothetical protein